MSDIENVESLPRLSLSPEAPPFSPITPQREPTVDGLSPVSIHLQATVSSPVSVMCPAPTSVSLSSQFGQAPGTVSSSTSLSHDPAPLSTQLAATTLQDPLASCISCTITNFPLATSSPISASCNPREWAIFKLVIDNIDMNVRPRHQTFERQTQSIHYISTYAVRDHINFSTHNSILFEW